MQVQARLWSEEKKFEGDTERQQRLLLGGVPRTIRKQLHVLQMELLALLHPRGVPGRFLASLLLLLHRERVQQWFAP
jgi:hypothetical protein